MSNIDSSDKESVCRHTLQSCEASFKGYNLWLLWLADDLHLLQVGSRSSKQKSVKVSPCSLHARGSFLQRSRKPSQVFSSVVLTMSSPIDDGWQQRGHSQDPPPFHRLSRQSLQKRCLQNSTTGFCRIFPQMGHDRSSARCDCLEAIAPLSPSFAQLGHKGILFPPSHLKLPLGDLSSDWLQYLLRVYITWARSRPTHDILLMNA